MHVLVGLTGIVGGVMPDQDGALDDALDGTLVDPHCLVGNLGNVVAGVLDPPSRP